MATTADTGLSPQAVSDDQKSFGDVLRGMSLDPLPDGWTPVDGLFMIKCLDPEGKPKWAIRFTNGINEEELLGAMVLHTAILRQDMLDNWTEEK